MLILLLSTFLLGPSANAQNVCRNPVFNEGAIPTPISPCTNLSFLVRNSCGPGVSGGANSLRSDDVPITTTNSINLKLACCLNGWKSRSASPGDYKLDCIQNWPQGSNTTFDALYSATSDAAGVTARYVPRDAAGVPIVGFYRANGTRCNFTGSNAQLITAMETAITTAAVAGAAGGTLPTFGSPAAADPRCGLVLRAALKVTCPNPDPSLAYNQIEGRSITMVSGTIRCRAAESIRPVFDLRDVSNPRLVGRSRLPGFTMMEARVGNQNQPQPQVMLHPGFNYRAVLSRLFNFPQAGTNNCTVTNNPDFNGFITGSDQLCTLAQ